MPVDVFLHLLVVGVEPPQPDRAHGAILFCELTSEGVFSAVAAAADFSGRGSSGGGASSSRLSRAMAKPMPSLTLLSAVQVLMPSR